ncbi:MAG: TonB-dependent receptor [Pseudomonadota bacterium]
MGKGKVKDKHYFEPNAATTPIRAAGLSVLGLVAWFFATAARAEDVFVDMELDQLLQLDITSVARRPISADETPAASFVITQEDIRRTGATTVPDLLRLVPGFEVADIDNSYAAVAPRGFNWRSSNKLLILIDGRSIYSTAFLGVLWDQQIIAVEEIERIEVLRGPGAALWGANAVNGVVNIVSKHAVDSLGAKAVVRYDTNNAGRFFVRQGFRLGDNGAMRIFANGRRDAGLVGQDGSDLIDDAKGGAAGFRLDWEPTARDAFTLQGDITDFQSEQPLGFLTPGPSSVPRRQTVLGDSASILARWVRSFSPNSGLNIQTYYDRMSRQEIDDDLFSVADNFNVEASHFFNFANVNTFVWGVGYRHTFVSASSSGFLNLDETAVRQNDFFGFVHNDAMLLDDRLLLSAGIRVEHSGIADWQFHPNVRALWNAPDDWRIWAAVSRATRTPALTELGGNFEFGELTPFSPINPTPFPVELALRGNHRLEAEPLIAYELGARKKWGDRASLDIALFAHRYKDLIEANVGQLTPILAPVSPGGPPQTVAFELIATFENETDATVYGVEASLDAKITDFWDVRAAFDTRHFEGVGISDRNILGVGAYLLRRSPTYQARLQSNFVITKDLDASVWVRRSGRILDTDIEALTELDVRIGWRPTKRAEITLIGENLLKSRRPAASDLNFLPTMPGLIERSVALQIGLRF